MLFLVSMHLTLTAYPNINQNLVLKGKAPQIYSTTQHR